MSKPVKDGVLEETERRLRQSEALYRTMVERTPGVTYLSTLDPACPVTHVSPQISSLIGYSPDEVLATPSLWLDSLHPDDLERVRAGLAETLNTGTVFREEYRLRTRGGEMVWVQDEARLVRDADGNPLCLQGIMVDVTARKRAEDQLRQSEDYFRSVLENALDIVLLVRPDGTISYVNPAIRAVSGYEPAEVLDRTVFEFLHPEDVNHARAMFEDVMTPPHEVHLIEVRSRAASGACLLFEVSGRGLVEAGELRGIILNARDITARREAECRAITEQAFRNAIEDSLLAGVGTIDLEGRQTYVNQALADMLGWPREELVGAVPPFPYWPPEAIPRMLEVIDGLRRGVCKPAELQFMRRDGRRVDILLVPSPIHGADGRQTGWLAVCYDLTERKQLEAQVRESQKMEAIGRLAGGVAHDFNNLLTAILGYSEFVQQQVAGTAIEDDVVQIRLAAESAARLTQQLLAFSRKQVLDPVRLNVSTVVADMQKILRRVLGEDVDLRTPLPTELPSVLADRGQLEQIIMNLAVNARDAMPDGGVLTLSTSHVRLEQRKGEVPPGEFVRLSVSDTGCGMDAQTMTHIFEPFFTTKGPGKGTGLGLATVYGIVKQSGGHVDVTSRPGHGARFDIYLPIAAGVTDESEDSTPERPSGSGTVLVVEDEVSVRNLVRRTLERSGYTVLTAGPVDAGSVAQNHIGHIDLFLLDVVMPVKCGPEVATELRVLHPEAQVLYMTGYSEHAVLERMHENERARILHKPFANLRLLEAVREVIGRRAISHGGAPPPGSRLPSQ